MTDLLRSDARIWFNALKNVYDMMALRGYQPTTVNFPPDIATFEHTILERVAGDDIDSQYLIFEKDNEIMYVGVFAFLEKLSKDDSTRILAFLMNETRIRNPARAPGNNKPAFRVKALIVAKALTSEGARALEALMIPPIDRDEQDPVIARLTLQFYTPAVLQISPLSHSYQSRYRLITSITEKENLRRRLVAEIDDKDKPLKDLIPFIYMEDDPICKWFAAEKGDVFYIIRTIGNKEPYYRYVTPSLMKQ